MRLLTLQDGGNIKETLTAYNPTANTYFYVINEGILPVSGFTSTIQELPTASDSEVI